MSVQSWQIACRRCGWSNSGAERRCTKCGQPLRTAPGLLVAGAASAVVPKAPPRRVVQPGGFFPRLIAAIIDGFILSVVLVPIYYFWLGTKTPLHLDPGGTQVNPFIEQLRAVGGSSLAGYTPDLLLSIAGFYIGAAIFVLFYYVGTWSILSGSPGQLVMSLRVVDKSARGIGFGRALIRYVCKGLFGWLAPVSALMVAISNDKRAIHDLLAGTYVIQFLDESIPEGEAALPPAQATTPAAAAQATAAPAASAPAVAPAAAAPAAAPAPVPAPAPAMAQPVVAEPAPAPLTAPAVAAATAATAAAAAGSSFERYVPAAVGQAPAAPTPVAAPPPAAPAPAVDSAPTTAIRPAAPPTPAVAPPPAVAEPAVASAPAAAIPPAAAAAPVAAQPPTIASPAATIAAPSPAAPAPLPPPFAPTPLPPPFAAAPAPNTPQASAAQVAPSPAPLPPSPGLYEPPQMTLPPLPPPTPAPASASPAPQPTNPGTPNVAEAGPRPAINAPPPEPYPLPFALPPVVHAPPAAPDQRGE